MPRTASSEIASKYVGRELRQTRQDLGLSQVGLARRLGVSGGYIASVEAGRHNLTIGQLMNIAVALGATLDIKLRPPEEKPMRLQAARANDGGDTRPYEVGGITRGRKRSKQT